MDNYKDNELKIKYFIKLRKYCLNKKAKRLRLSIVDLYYKRKIQEKYLKIWGKYARKNREIQRICNYLMKERNRSTLHDILDTSILNPSLSKSIFAISHNRTKLMRKYFNEFKKFISLTKKCQK